MNTVEKLYVVAQEECADIIHAISKIMQFGEDNYHPDKPEETNEQALVKKYYQLRAVMDMLFDNGVIHDIPYPEAVILKDKKRIEVWKYLQLSKPFDQTQEKE